VVGWGIRSRHAKVQDESKDDGAQVLDGRYGRSAIRIDAHRPGLDRWVITLEGCSIGKGPASGRDEARRRGEPGAGGAALLMAATCWWGIACS
jgi:hypothetical protein